MFIEAFMKLMIIWMSLLFGLIILDHIFSTITNNRDIISLIFATYLANNWNWNLKDNVEC